MNDIQTLHREFRFYSETFKGNTRRGVQWLEGCFNSLMTYQKIEDIRDLNQNHLENWLIHGKTEYLWSAKTIRNYLTGVSIFLDWCVSQSHIAFNPAKKIPRPKLPKRQAKSLTRDQASLIYDYTKIAQYPSSFQKARAIAIIACFLFTGIRLNELLHLRLIDINLEDRNLFVKQGKCSKDRTIPITSQLVNPLKNYLKECETLKHESPWLFITIAKGKRMQDDVIRRLVEKIRNKTKVSFHPHMLRHTCATLLLKSGSDLRPIQKILGHSDISTTMLYLNIEYEHVREQMAKHPL